MTGIIFVLIHIIGAALAIIIHLCDGTFENAAKYGDGIRFSRPTDVIFLDLFLWEIEFLLFVMTWIESLINNLFTWRN